MDMINIDKDRVVFHSNRVYSASLSAELKSVIHRGAGCKISDIWSMLIDFCNIFTCGASQQVNKS